MRDVPQFLDVLQITDENLVVNCCPKHTRSEEVNTVKVRYVYPSVKRHTNVRSRLSSQKSSLGSLGARKKGFLPGVGERALRAVLLYVHAEETHIDAIDLLESEKCFGSVGEALSHLVVVDKPGKGESKLSVPHREPGRIKVAFLRTDTSFGSFREIQMYVSIPEEEPGGDGGEGRRAARAYLAFMPGLTSTVLSELATTLTNTSPASGWFCLFKYLFTRSSMYVPNRVTGNPDIRTRAHTHTQSS